MAVLVLDSFER